MGIREGHEAYMVRRLSEVQNEYQKHDHQMELPMKDDNIDPHHYNKWVIEPKDFIIKNHLPFCEGNIIKYVMRWRDKNGIEDLNKAKEYIDFLILNEQGK